MRKATEKEKQRMREYYRKHREELLIKQREYYHKHKNDQHFIETRRKWRVENRKHELERLREWKRIRRLEVIEKLGGRCKECGLNDIRVLELHHKYGRPINEVKGKVLNLNYPLEKLEVLCANCHKIKTLERNN